MISLPKPEVILTHESDLDGLVSGLLLQRLAHRLFDEKVPLEAQFLKPVPITRDNLDLVVKAGWIKKEALCKGVSGDKIPAACK